jgi:hypothetical protein
MAESTVTLAQALEISEQLSAPDQLRLISLLSERLRDGMAREAKPVDMLSLAGLGADLWSQVDVATYLEQERSSWNR